MKDIRKILVPTDFSVPADYAIKYAAELATHFNAAIVLYHSFTPYESGFASLEKSRAENLAMEERLLKRLDHIRKTLYKTHKKIKVSTHVDRGPEQRRILEYSKKKKIDLVVMGTKGSSGLKEAVLGSLTSAVIDKSKCPVMAIPPKKKFKNPAVISFVSKYDRSDNSVLKYLSGWVRFFNSVLNIIHIDDAGNTILKNDKLFEAYKKKIEKKFPEITFTYQHRAGKNISNSIAYLAKKRKSDILAISEKKESKWAQLFHKSVTKSTLNQISIPILAVPVK